MSASRFPYNVVFPVRPDCDTSWGVQYVKELRRTESVQIHVLAVCPYYDALVRRFFSPPEVNRIHREDAQQVLAPTCDALDRAGVPYVRHMAVGPSAKVIADFAREHRCRLVVIGPEKLGGISGFLRTSLTRQIHQLVNDGASETCAVF